MRTYMQGRFEFMLGMVLLAGCASTPAVRQAESPAPEPAASAAGQDGPVQVYMVVEALSREGLHVLQPGETLRSGDRMAVRVEIDRPAYVYVLYADAKNQVNKVFPERATGDRLMQPGRSQRVPDVGDWFTIVGPTGQENVFVVVNTAPLPDDELTRRVEQDIKERPIPLMKAPKSQPKKYVWQPKQPAPDPASGTGTSGQAKPSDELPPPGLLKEVAVRSLSLQHGLKPQVDSKGTAVLRFSFGHR